MSAFSCARWLRSMTIALTVAVFVSILGHTGVALFAHPAMRPIVLPEQPIVRVLHLGDSHTGSGEIRSVVRDALVSRHGDGGAGWQFPWGGSGDRSQSGVTSGWTRLTHAPARIEDTPVVGLTGEAIEAQGPGRRAWLQAEASQIRVHFLTQPGGGRAALIVDGGEIGSVDLAASGVGTRLLTWGTSLAPRMHTFEIVTRDQGLVRLLGVSLENASGIAYSPLWMNGAQAAWLLRLPEPVLAGLIRAESPDAIVLAFGTNEACSHYFDPSAYKSDLDRLLFTLRAAAPRAAFIIVAPPDAAGERVVPAALDEIERIQRDVAWAWNASFLDLREVMGGAGSIKRWRETGLARKDEVHLTHQGYQRLGRAILATALETLEAPGTSYASRPARDARASAEQVWRPGAVGTGQHSALYLFRTTDGHFIMTGEPAQLAGRPGRWVGPRPEGVQ